MSLTYDQRKALRRLSRGQSIPARMWDDEIVSRCVERAALVPPKPVAEMNIVEYCDWEATLLSHRPTLNEYGRELFVKEGL